MVTKDIPMLIADASIKRIARKIEQDIADGRLSAHIVAPDEIASMFNKETILFFAALTWITRVAPWN